MSDDDLLTVTQAADALGTTSQTIRNWIQAKRLNATRIGNRYRIASSEIERLGGIAARSGEGPWEHAADQPFRPLVRKPPSNATDNDPLRD